MASVQFAAPANSIRCIPGQEASPRAHPSSVLSLPRGPSFTPSPARECCAHPQSGSRLVVAAGGSKGSKGKKGKGAGKAKDKAPKAAKEPSAVALAEPTEAAAAAEDGAPEAVAAEPVAVEAVAAEEPAPVAAAAPAAREKEDDRLVIKAAEPTDGKLQVQVQVPGVTTQGIYNKIMNELARTCPPVPGARKSKGGKATKVDPAVVIRLVGKNRVTGFVVKEVVNTTLATVVEQRGLSAEKEAKTLQSEEELAALFVPGQPFAFDAVITLLDAVEGKEAEPATVATVATVAE